MPSKWLFFFLLILLQVLVGILYKISQNNDRYTYSTYSVMTLAESGKFIISLVLYATQEADSSFVQLCKKLVNECSFPNFLRLTLLAVMYFLNNQLAFTLFLWADPASINMLKAGSSIITALIWCICMGQVISVKQWGAIVLQVAGLIVVQVDACKNIFLLQPFAYYAISVSVLITSISSVWNEHQLKTIPLSLHQQNIILYMNGMLLNSLGHVGMSVRHFSHPSFLQGYTWITVCIVIVNACFGVVVTAVYKYADAVLKTLANACTTVVLLFFSVAFFGLPVNIVRSCGCVVVLIAVAQYAFIKADKETIISWHTRRSILACVSMACCMLLVVPLAFQKVRA